MIRGFLALVIGGLLIDAADNRSSAGINNERGVNRTAAARWKNYRCESHRNQVILTFVLGSKTDPSELNVCALGFTRLRQDGLVNGVGRSHQNRKKVGE